MKYQDVAPVKLYTADAKRNEYRSPHKVTLVSPVLTKSEKAQQFVMNSLSIKFKDTVNVFRVITRTQVHPPHKKIQLTNSQ